jgi:hypothetical protein
LLELDRFTRQRRLPEIGEAGQLRISSARFALGPHAGLEIEREYLSRAGATCTLSTEPAVARPFTHHSAFAFEETRALGEGAWRALEKLRSALGIEVR